MPINKILMYSDGRVQIWVERTGFIAVFSDATTDRKQLSHEEDLFALPMNGLVRLAAEYLDELKPRLPQPARSAGRDISADDEIWL